MKSMIQLRPAGFRSCASALALLAGTLLGAGLLEHPASAQTPSDPLAAGFADPPASARPRVWWHWMNGNITQDGITKDLEWMKRVGIGGLQNFDANLTTPQIVDHRLVYMTPEWKAAFRHAATLADKLGLELAIAASPGWSETGGPWVPPVDGMKKLVWSEAEVQGGSPTSTPLPQPPAVTGPYQTLPMPPSVEEMIAGGAVKGPPKPTFYSDAAVLAWPVAAAGAVPAANATDGEGHALDAAALADPSLDTGAEIGRGSADRPASITLAYAAPRTVRSATLFVPGLVSMFSSAAFLPVLEARDGTGWRKLAELAIADVPTTVSFAPATAREFRIVFAANSDSRAGLGAPAPGAEMPNLFGGPPAATMKIAQLQLSDQPKIDRFEAKAGLTLVQDYYALSRQAGPDLAGVAPEQVIDLSGKLRPDGSLDWTPPPGRWHILRLGYSLLGTTNHPAPAEATGLEVDKYDGAAVRRYLQTYLGMYRDAAGPELIGAKGVRAMLTDSIEVGASNWTPALVARFRALRGYDPTPWLPALTGTIVGSRSRSDAFLYDFRRTLADLIASDHYGTVAAFAHENGLKLYGEALEDVRPVLGDDMAMRSHTDVPMAALWTYARDGAPRPTLIGDMRGAASVAHIYGQNLVAAESMTSAFAPWAFAPSDLRRFIDLEFANGINRPVIHTSVHQPVDDKVPGLSLMIFGQYFNRHETWAEMARPWVDYIARNSFLLQQGRNVADVAYFYGEEAPLTALYAKAPLTDTPRHYAWDFVNPDVLLNRLQVEGGDLVAASGARYRILYLGGTSRRMTLPVLRRIATLAEAGATIVGNAPTVSPALGDDRAEYDRLVRRLWSGGAQTAVGNGRVIAGQHVEAALAATGLAPDFAWRTDHADSEILFVHRKMDSGDAYFVDNRGARAEQVEARFRVSGKTPEIWHADTGLAEPVSYRIEGDTTIVPLDMAAEESFFVLFRKPAATQAATVTKPALATLATLDGPWDVAFQPGRGAPATARLNALAPLNAQAEPGIRYFSGTASYSRSFTLPRGVRPGAQLWLDLGRIGDIAEVRVNGRLVGTAWHAPYRLDIGPATKAGTNRLEIRVADLWVNRLIGDVQPGATRITFTAAPTYHPDAPLRPSGLIGPVTLIAAAK